MEDPKSNEETIDLVSEENKIETEIKAYLDKITKKVKDLDSNEEDF